MKKFDAKLVFSALGIVALLASPALAKKPSHASHVTGPASYNMIPSYDKDGGVVGIPDPDQSGAQR